MTIHITERELAERWRKSRRSLQRMRANGSGPAHLRIGRSVLYRLEDVKTYERARRTEGAER